MKREDFFERSEKVWKEIKLNIMYQLGNGEDLFLLRELEGINSFILQIWCEEFMNTLTIREVNIFFSLDYFPIMNYGRNKVDMESLMNGLEEMWLIR